MPRTIPDEVHPLVKLLCEDRRYKVDAYQFVKEGLRYAQELRYPPKGAGDTEGKVSRHITPQDLGALNQEIAELEGKVSRHITGQDLCHALRRLAHDRYGYLALPVLQSWGVRSTSDFGEVVYNLIKIGDMSMSPGDSREHFDDVYDFEQVLLRDFTISPAKEMAK